jgi:hypothetical protein
MLSVIGVISEFDDCASTICKNAKAVPLHATEALGGRGRIAPIPLIISALDGDEWSAPRPGLALAPRKGFPVPIVKEAGWAPEPVTGLEKKSSHLYRGFILDRPVVQPVARHYTD